MNGRRVCSASFLLLLMVIPLWAGGGNDEMELEKVNAVLQEYGKLLIDGDYEAWGELHTQDVIKMPPKVPPTTNRADMVARSSVGSDQARIVEFNVETRDTKISGDMAYNWGMYTVKIQPNAGGPPILVDGKFLTLLEKQSDGRWLISHDCFNSNVPPPSP
ncbi:MAG: nuclear transport factor 2 family protein [Spirochaetaceae bacterium]|nr:nuclear transport factor 2 family protein [Spirochaetaceae bacterium]